MRYFKCGKCQALILAKAVMTDGTHMDGWDVKCGPCVEVFEPGTVIGYRVISADDPQEVSEQVRGCLADGWEPSGILIQDRYRGYHQPLILRAKAED